MEEIVGLLAAMSCNAHTICDPEVRTVGKGIFPVIAMANHSCTPNAVLLFEGTTGVLRCTAEVAPGEELCISYVDLAAPAVIRKRELQEGYYFDCRCSRCNTAATPGGSGEDATLGGFPCSACRDGATLPVEYFATSFIRTCQLCGHQAEYRSQEAAATSAGSMAEEATALRASGNAGEGMRKCQAALELIERTKCSTAGGAVRMKVNDELMWCCLQAEDWSSARKACRAALPAYLVAYEVHEGPLLGLQYYTLGKIEWYLENVSAAVEALREACRILSITHGEGLRLVCDVRQLLSEAEASLRHDEDNADWRLNN